MNPQAHNSESARSRSITVLCIALGLYCAFLLSMRGELLFSESRGHMLPLAVFKLLFPTTRAELILIATFVVASFFHFRSLSRKPAALPAEAARIPLLARTSPLRLTSVSIGWSLFWPLFILNTIFQVLVLSVHSAIASVLLHVSFYATLLWLALYLLKHEVNRRYGVLPVAVVWPFLWRAVAVTLLANFILFESIERERLFDRLLVIEWFGVKSVIALAQCVGLGWAAHRCLASHTHNSNRDGFEQQEP